jgi:hypothetical protein
MWCGGCYTSDPKVTFFVNKLESEGGESERDPKDRARLQKAWGKKHRSENDFHQARDGDHTLVPFECDLCIFRKLKGRSPVLPDPIDELLLGCIRRMTLDVFWSSATPTVQGNRDKLAMGIKLSELVGLKGPFIHQGPLPDHDHCGYEVAIEMLLYSKREGKHSKDHLQFDTIRKLRSCYSNQVRASPQANQESVSLGDAKGNYQRFSTDPCGSFLFYRFMRGLKNRMGQDWRPNKGMSTKLFLRMLDDVERRIEGAPSVRDKHRWIVFHSFSVVSYSLSLRGREALLLDLEGLHRHWTTTDGTWDSDGQKYVIVPLQGRVKGETNDRDHLLPCIQTTSSGVKVRDSLDRLMKLKAATGLLDGPAISDQSGRGYSTRDMTDSLVEILEDLFVSDRSLFPADINSVDDVKARYQVFRSYRRTSDTRAAEMNVSSADVDIVNRWETFEKAKGSRPGMPMRLHYAQIEYLIKPFLRYTWAM